MQTDQNQPTPAPTTPAPTIPAQTAGQAAGEAFQVLTSLQRQRIELTRTVEALDDADAAKRRHLVLKLMRLTRKLDQLNRAADAFLRGATLST